MDAKEPKARLVFEERSRDKRGVRLHATLRLIHPTDQPVVFTGFSVNNPVLARQQGVPRRMLWSEKGK